MAEEITAEQFAASDGVGDWTVQEGQAVAVFDTGSFARGVELIDRIGVLADAANHHPDVDLRFPSVTVRLVTHDAGSKITEKDVALAREISSAAADLDIAAQRD